MDQEIMSAKMRQVLAFDKDLELIIEKGDERVKLKLQRKDGSYKDMSYYRVGATKAFITRPRKDGKPTQDRVFTKALSALAETYIVCNNLQQDRTFKHTNY